MKIIIAFVLVAFLFGGVFVVIHIINLENNIKRLQEEVSYNQSIGTSEIPLYQLKQYPKYLIIENKSERDMFVGKDTSSAFILRPQMALRLEIEAKNIINPF